MDIFLVRYIRYRFFVFLYVLRTRSTQAIVTSSVVKNKIIKIKKKEFFKIWERKINVLHSHAFSTIIRKSLKLSFLHYKKLATFWFCWCACHEFLFHFHIAYSCCMWCIAVLWRMCVCILIQAKINLFDCCCGPDQQRYAFSFFFFVIFNFICEFDVYWAQLKHYLFSCLLCASLVCHSLGRFL